MGIRGRKEGGERGILMLSFFGEFGRESCKEGFLVGDFEGIQQLRPCTRFGLGGPKGYLWSWVVCETSPVGRVAKLVWAG